MISETTTTDATAESAAQQLGPPAADPSAPTPAAERAYYSVYIGKRVAGVTAAHPAEAAILGVEEVRKTGGRAKRLEPGFYAVEVHKTAAFLVWRFAVQTAYDPEAKALRHHWTSLKVWHGAVVGEDG